MNIKFQDRDLEKNLNDEKRMLKAYGQNRAKRLRVRMAVLGKAKNLSEVPNIPPDRCHKLTGDYKGHFAVDLDQPYRLIFKPLEPVPLLPDGGFDLKSITSIIILGVSNHYGR